MAVLIWGAYLGVHLATPAFNVTEISASPRIVVADGFVTPQEADYLVNEYGGRMGPIGVVTVDGHTAVLPNTATSSIGTPSGTDPVVQRINRRIMQMLPIPPALCEPLHLLRYETTEYFRGHLDAHAKPGFPTSSRVATCLIYLSDVEEGGETFFPLASAQQVDQGLGTAGRPPSCFPVGKDPETQGDERYRYYDGSEVVGATDEKGVGVRPRRGRAVLWWNKREDGSVDWRSKHVGCPVVRGVKWAATRWMHDSTRRQRRIV